ncbi:hypothetical protein GHK86_02430 [Acidimicrobiaceae bacterium USS-CC1]|uniref:Reverse transcriptase domain-containing protein n=1 Tax=Acidiferrimicrobium australe TaxID=2664430 RepID=A0ABW9QQ25_9ACTN|nr:hypothetical protein [Acidiferrimicrobium australe]
MNPILIPELDETALIVALEAEAQYDRTWLPPEPWWDALLSSKSDLASAIHRRLTRGGKWDRSATVDVRKPGHGIRPVSVMSPEVRIVYRAIASALVQPENRPDRSAKKYADFVLEPVWGGNRNRTAPFLNLLDTRYSHVVITDIVAYYQYIDHALLRDELDLGGGHIGMIDALVELLADIEGRSFGLPQRSAPSDWLSDRYAARIDRWMTRDGFDVWRYNDDFRVGCTSYAEALRAIESLSRAARELGLVLNDQKTAAPTFATYLNHNVNVEIHDASAQIDPSDVEAAISTDYAPEDDEQALAEAVQTLEQLWDPETDGQPMPNARWDLRNLSADQHRAVRRALNTLTRQGHDHALPRLLSILAYQPAMTHRVVRYAEALARHRPEDIGRFIELAIGRLSLNEWQRAWLAFGARACSVELDEDRPLASWLQTQMGARPNSIVAAEAAVTLAESSRVTFEVLERHLRDVSPDFGPWYLHAVAVLNRNGAVNPQQLGALRHSSAVAAAILS